MKKLGLGCLLAFLMPFTALAYDVVPVAGENYSYLFNIYHQGENSGIEGEYGKSIISYFEILNNYRTPIFKSGKWWASVVNSSALTPVSYSIVSEDEYNAGAQSSYTTVAEKPYQVTYVNARINELMPTGTDSSEADATEGDQSSDGHY